MKPLHQRQPDPTVERNDRDWVGGAIVALFVIAVTLWAVICLTGSK